MSSAAPASRMLTWIRVRWAGSKRGFAEFLGVHFTEAFEAGHLQTLFAGGADRGQQAAEILERDLALAAAEDVAGRFDAGALLGDQAIGCQSRSPPGLSGRR